MTDDFEPDVLLDEIVGWLMWINGGDHRAVAYRAACAQIVRINR